jgi:hypothetical protein
MEIENLGKSGTFMLVELGYRVARIFEKRFRDWPQCIEKKKMKSATAPRRNTTPKPKTNTS